MSPPQSWPTSVTSREVDRVEERRASRRRGARRCSRRAAVGLSERPKPTRSGAIARRPGVDEHRDHVPVQEATTTARRASSSTAGRVRVAFVEVVHPQRVARRRPATSHVVRREREVGEVRRTARRASGGCPLASLTGTTMADNPPSPAGPPPELDAERVVAERARTQRLQSLGRPGRAARGHRPSRSICSRRASARSSRRGTGSGDFNPIALPIVLVLETLSFACVWLLQAIASAHRPVRRRSCFRSSRATRSAGSRPVVARRAPRSRPACSPTPISTSRLAAHGSDRAVAAGDRGTRRAAGRRDPRCHHRHRSSPRVCSRPRGSAPRCSSVMAVVGHVAPRDTSAGVRARELRRAQSPTCSGSSGPRSPGSVSGSSIRA